MHASATIWNKKLISDLSWSDCPPGWSRSKWVCVLALRSLPYEEYLRTVHWDELRAKALKRDGFQCRLSQLHKGPYHVHHRTYERKGYESLDDLITLCGDCHSKFHDTVKAQISASFSQ